MSIERVSDHTSHDPVNEIIDSLVIDGLTRDQLMTYFTDVYPSGNLSIAEYMALTKPLLPQLSASTWAIFNQLMIPSRGF